MSVSETHELDRLRTQVRDLELALGVRFLAPYEMHLTPQEERMLGALYAREIVFRENVDGILSNGYARTPKLFDVVICHLRTKLKPFGIEIKTVYGRGYRMLPESKKVLRALVERAAA